ncbi:MAG: hypothetical protein ACI4S2_04165 [Lachnospiraceae bacterium]
MNSWILICNNKYFNLKKAFETENFITWPIIEEIKIGDVVFFYVTNPYRAILYKCEVTDIGLHRMDDSTKECVTHALFYDGSQTYMRLKKIMTYPDGFLTEEDLGKNGIQSLQISARVPADFKQYVEKKEKSLIRKDEKSKKLSFKRIIVVLVVVFVVLILSLVLKNYKKNLQPKRTSTASTETLVEKYDKNDNVTDFSTETTQGNSDGMDLEDMTIHCYTTTLLKGDSIGTRLKEDTWVIDGGSSTITWSSDDRDIAFVDNNGILIAKSVGTCNLTAKYEGKIVSQQITVVDVDNNSGATVSADYEKISLNSNGEDTITLTFGGDIPEHFSTTAYYSAGLSLNLTWGELIDKSVTLTIGDVFSEQEQGYVTIIVYDQYEPTHIVASTKINVKISK